MRKQYRVIDQTFEKIRVFLYHDGEVVEKKDMWKDDEYNKYIEKLEVDGYDYGWTPTEVENAKHNYEYRNKNCIDGAPHWIFVRQDDNDMPIYKCSHCGRKQFGRSKYCGSCGTRLYEEEE